MQAWPMRVLGALHISFVVLGAFYAVSTMHMRWGSLPGPPDYQDWAVFLALSVISIFLLLYLGHLGIRLVKKDAEALWQSCLFFLGEIVYFAAVLYVTTSLVPDSMSAVATGFWGMALNPLLPQFVTGYPLVGLVIGMVLLLIRRSPPGTY